MFIPYSVLIPAFTAAVTYFYSLHAHATPSVTQQTIPSHDTFQTQPLTTLDSPSSSTESSPIYSSSPLLPVNPLSVRTLNHKEAP